MPKVKAFQVAGVEMWFWSHDHDPPHFHAKRAGDWEIKVGILDGKIEIVRPPDARIKNAARKAILNGVERHRAELLKECEQARGKMQNDGNDQDDENDD